MERSHFRFFALAFGLLVCALSLYKLFLLFTPPPAEAAWTPAHLALPLSSTSDRFEVLVKGAPLASSLEAQKLLVGLEGGGAETLSKSDLTVRVNDQDRIRLSRMPLMLGLAGLAGGAFVLLVIGLFTPLIGAFRPHGLVDLHLTT